MKEFVKLFVMNKLKFPDVNDIIKKIVIKLDYYHISDEMIFDNKDFQKLMDEYKLDLR